MNKKQARLERAEQSELRSEAQRWRSQEQKARQVEAEQQRRLQRRREHADMYGLLLFFRGCESLSQEAYECNEDW